MTASEAEGFTEYSVYYLGESFDGLPLDAIVYSETRGPTIEARIGAAMVPMKSFSVIYMDHLDDPDPRDDQFTLDQRPASGYVPGADQPGGAQISINGTTATLYMEGARVILNMQLDETDITIYG